MFGLFKKNPLRKLEKEHEKLLEEAMQLQRGGDIKGFAVKTEEAAKLADKIAALAREQEL